MDDIRNPLDAERLRTVAPDAFETRRDFLKRTAVTAGLTAGMGLVLDPDVIVAEAARRQRRQAIPGPRNLPIDTFVVLMMENRSFDHYLGWLPGADGRQAGLEFTNSQGQKFATHHLNFFQSCGFEDPDHSWQGGRTELDGGKMDGFLRSQSDVFAIGYYEEGDVPFTPHAAKAFTTFDRFFCSLLGPTYPNREYMHAAQSYGKMDNSLPAGSSGLGFPDTTIFNALAQVGISGTYFYADLPISALWGTAGLGRSQQVQKYYEQAAAGTLPALSFVDPAFQGESQGTSGDEHPLADIRVGQTYVADIVHAFLESPQWERGALFMIYDEWGGFFDHVVPPRVPDLRMSRDDSLDFGQMGFRIPAVVVSPYARRGYVDHSIYGFESILKMIRYRYGLPPLTPRDLYANNIAAAFDFESPPDYSIPALPQPPEVIAGACAGSPPIDSGGAGIDDGPLGAPPPLPLASSAAARGGHHHGHRHELSHSRHEPVPGRAQDPMLTTGYLERLGFNYRPATPATLYRHPSKLGMRA
jgi:phospholipase C